MNHKIALKFITFLLISLVTVVLTGCSSSSSGGGSTGPGPNPTITLSTSISATEIIAAAATGSSVAITGSVGGDAKVGDTVSIRINGGAPSTGTVASDRTYSIDIPVLGSYLSTGSFTLTATVTSTDANGLTGTATATFNYNGGTLVPTISLDNITDDNIIDADESISSAIPITGSVGGDAKEGDIVAVTVNGVTVTGPALVGTPLTFSINVFGSSLLSDTDRTVDVSIISTDGAGNSGTASDAKSYVVDISGSGGDTLVCPDPIKPCYDIIYVRYPIADTAVGKVSLPSGENPYAIEPGADLMLLLQNGGGEIVLVDCTDCSVMDPYISYDGKTVYYALYDKVIENPFGDEYASWIYKINLAGHPDFNDYKPIRLTYNDGYDSVQFRANRDPAGNVKDGHDQSSWRAIRDMAPVPLADGRLLFTSNRSALTAFHPGTDATIKGSMQQLYVMDDHDGTAVTSELANIHMLETGNIHLVQHPIQLKDGRILFSTWQDVATKQDVSNFQYAMMSLFTVHPDGSNLQQFTEPHDHHKNVEHFITQLSDEQVVWGQYYPLLEGFGIIMRAPVSSDGPDFIRGSVDQIFGGGRDFAVSFREFDRKGMVTITPHTDPGDSIAPGSSGKYAMPSAVNDGDLLVAYSTGTVNQTDFVCSPTGQCEALKSGIYLIRNADGNEADYITDPASQLIKVRDDPNYNEIWPRAVLSYQDIHGKPAPEILNNLAISLPDDNNLDPGEANAIVGTSSMYNREPLNEGNPDPFSSSKGREFTNGNWTIQGADAGVFANDDIYAVRIIVTPPKPYTKPIDVFTDTARWNSISRYLEDDRLQYVVARYGSEHGERWEILGEFPVKKSLVIDGQGNPDTSWMAKVPADTPFFIQTIDDKSMTLTSELAWRALKSGEKRTDCGGCHAHSIEPLDFSTTEAGKDIPASITVQGGFAFSADPPVSATTSDVIMTGFSDGLWDLTAGRIPLLAETGVIFKERKNENGNIYTDKYSYGVEFNRDIVPILDNRCVSCHQTGQSGEMFILNSDPWSVISQTGDYSDNELQVSKYIRMPQARQSLLVWATWGERLDGRTNSTRDDDIDFPAHPLIPGITDEEKRTIARWVDLGSPIDFPVTDDMGYTDDYQLPVVNIYTPQLGGNSSTQLKVGFADAKSGIDWTSLSVKYYKIEGDIATQLSSLAGTVVTETTIQTLRGLISDATITVDTGIDVNSKNILTVNLPISAGEYVTTVSVNDNAGNTGITSRRFKIN